MASGRLNRSPRRYPAARRRQRLHGTTRYGHRGRGLPPHLIAGSRSDRKPETVFSRRNFIIGAALFVVTSMIGVVVTTVTSAVAGAFEIVRQYRKVNGSLPDASRVFVNTFQTSRILDRNGKLLQEIEHPDYGWRTFITMDKMADDFINATVSAEDATFWTNPGIEPVAFVRAAMIIVSGAGSSGGSTITQQLVRAVYPDQINKNDRSISRKFREALAAVAMAKEYSKEDIFTMYVNQIFYGFRSYGIEAASNTLFNKHASELTLAESAFLAGLPQSPTAYDPTVPERFPIAKRRQSYVLDQMLKYGYITKQQREDAWNEPLNIVNDRNSLIKAAPHFIIYTQEYIAEQFGADALYGGFNFYTSIDLDLQHDAEQIVANGVANMSVYQRNNAATVAIVPWSGEILCMVGSAGFNNEAIAGQVNYATALIQPGSSMKPIAYAAAFEQGWNPATVVLDVPTEWPIPGQAPYAPNNYTKLFYGAIPVRQALANSLNIPAVKATEYAGVESVMDVARRMGLVTSLNQDAGFYGISLGLGSGEVKLLEHVNAYATFANGGTYVPANPLRKVTDSQGNVLLEVNRESVATTRKAAINPGIAHAITTVLTDNEARSRLFTSDNLFGNTQTQLGRPTAAKSGTTENWRDLWTMGYTSDLAIGAWVGRTGDAGQGALQSIDGIVAAGPIWQDLMLLIHDNPAYRELLLGPDGNPVPEAFPVPDEAKQMDLCAVTGHLPGRGETVREWVVAGMEPTLECNQLSPYERTQYDAMVKELERGANWAGGATDSLQRYRDVVQGGGGAPIQPIDDAGNSDGGTNNRRPRGGDQPVIDPIN